MGFLWETAVQTGEENRKDEGSLLPLGVAEWNFNMNNVSNL